MFLWHPTWVGSCYFTNIPRKQLLSLFSSLAESYSGCFQILKLFALERKNYNFKSIKICSQIFHLSKFRCRETKLINRNLKRLETIHKSCTESSRTVCAGKTCQVTPRWHRIHTYNQSFHVFANMVRWFFSIFRYIHVLVNHSGLFLNQVHCKCCLSLL